MKPTGWMPRATDRIQKYQVLPGLLGCKCIEDSGTPNPLFLHEPAGVRVNRRNILSNVIEPDSEFSKEFLIGKQA
jgi:hypothetical protein